jgi:hypothetical protein
MIMAKTQPKAAAKPATIPAADPISAKALELSGLTQDQFSALTEGEQENYLNSAKAELATPFEPPAADAAPVAINTVKMVRDAETNPKPHTADVHPDEVDNFKAGGWVVSE